MTEHDWHSSKVVRSSERPKSGANKIFRVAILQGRCKKPVVSGSRIFDNIGKIEKSVNFVRWAVRSKF